MQDALNEIYQFLVENREYNKRLQTRYYNEILSPHTEKVERAIALLYHIANTQSQPKIDKLASFYQLVYSHQNSLDTFQGFLSIIDTKNKCDRNYRGLFQALRDQSGWGNKTSALFVKSIYHLHNGDYPINLKIWNDVPAKITENDKLYLPVDQVIISIFKYINLRSWSFARINKELGKYYLGSQIEVWDDLWFWGFISQVGGGSDRQMKWNPNKYWILKESDKDSKMISKIQSKAEEFIGILERAKKRIQKVK